MDGTRPIGGVERNMTQNHGVTALTILRRLGACLNGSGIRAVWVWLLAVCIWLASAALVFVGLTEIMRIVAIAIMTGAVLFAGVYEWIQKDKDWRATIGLLILTWTFSAATLYFANRLIPVPAPLRGPLVAADDKVPKMYCSMRGVEKRDLVMLFGNDAVIGHGQGPFTPAQIGSCSALRINQTSTGLLIDAFSYDSSNNLIFRIERNVFEGLDLFAGFLKEERPDRSTLLITDERNQVVFGVRYLHRNIVRVWGTFKCGDTRPVDITENAVVIDRIPLDRHQCISVKAGDAYGLLFRSRS